MLLIKRACFRQEVKETLLKVVTRNLFSELKLKLLPGSFRRSADSKVERQSCNGRQSPEVKKNEKL